jgi:hypothetical protein
VQAAGNAFRFIAHQRGEEQGWPRHGRWPEEAVPVWCQA